MLTLTALALLAADVSVTPPVQQAPEPVRASTTPRMAKLFDGLPSPPHVLVGRAVLAPVVGGVGVLLLGALGGLAGLALGGGRGWEALGAAGIGAVVGGAIGFPLGAAMGASVFSDDLGALFVQSIGWTLAAVGGAGLVFLIGLLVAPALGIVGVVAGLVATAAVPYIVEARRLAVAAEERERSTAVPVARF